MTAWRLNLTRAVGRAKRRKEQAAEDREAQQADEGLDRDEDIGRSRGRDEFAVADRGERLDAEEDAVLEAREGRGGVAGDRVGPGQPVDKRGANSRFVAK